ncbi:hypothetical protein, partial [Bacillus smithii]|uniref:hypothetical protein n=1 Tax=Bacillus smithii TaxID=1479 RepID=UPI003D1B0197
MIARKSSIATNTYQTDSTQKSQPTVFYVGTGFYYFSYPLIACIKTGKNRSYVNSLERLLFDFDHHPLMRRHELDEDSELPATYASLRGEG